MDYTAISRSDDRSDSGVSSLRTGSYASGDERSVSRSSALSSTDDTQQGPAFNSSGAPACVWRDPSPVAAEASVHRIQSVQHRSLLMSHSSPPAPAGPPVSGPPLIHPLQHLPPPGLYSHLPEVMWKQQQHYASRTLSAQHAIAEGDRERAFREHREVEVSELVNQHKEREKLERERQDRDKQMERERECSERVERERRAAEQAVHKHFEESLRLAQHKHNLTPRWNIINSLPPPAEEARKRTEQDVVHQQQIIPSERIRQESHERVYLPGVPRSASGFKVEYPPPGHSRAKQLSEKPMVHTLPKAEPNFNLFGYPAYQPSGYLAHEGNKVKQEQSKTPLTSMASISVSKTALNLERDRDILPNPPPLTSDLKSSVIVKNEGKSPLHHESSKLPRQHSPSPKHQIISAQQMHFHKTSAYEFQPLPRTHVSPSHSPHHLNSHHMALEAQNLVGKTHSQRPLPPPGSAEQRFKLAAMNPFPYGMPGVTYGISPGSCNTKPKVSSPAPGHMYMKPSPSPQPLMHHPPPAHRSTSLGYSSRLYPSKVQGAQMPPTSLTPAHPTSCQTQPLDLGLSNARDEHSISPKRKGGTSLPACDNNKRQRCDPLASYGSLSHGLGHPLMTQNSSSLPFQMQPLLSRVGEPSPLIASAATTITTVVNTVAYCSPAVTMTTSLPAATPTSGDDRPNTPHPASPLPVVTCSSPPAEDVSTPPCTPIKASSVDSEKSNSPGPMRTPASYPVHKLKKAWLQRHSGEDGTEDNSVIAGPGSCVTPVTLIPTSAIASISSKECVNSSSDCLTDSVQTELGGSVGKCRQFSAGNRKGSPVLPTIKGNSGVFLNGHTNELPSSKPSVDDDSSSSGSDRELKSSRKRKPPKVKKKKGSGAALRKAAAEELKRKRLAAIAASESSGSDKESATDKDSDSGTTKKTANSKEPRKRGRRPKSSKFPSNSESRQKKSQGQPPATLRDPFLKPSVSQLKKTGESFLQDGACFEVAPKLAKCRECRWTPNQRSKNTPNIFCRFYAFRKLRYTKNGQLAIAGFSDPHQDAAEEDLRLWLPFPDTQPADLDLDVSRLILMQVGDQFCDLLQQESACPEIHMSDDKTIAWKRVVQGVREMCDVCETTLFNFHWACGKCGFVVCIDCYKGRKNGTVKVLSDSDNDGKDEYLWLSCTNRQPHEQEKLMLTQIIAGDSLLKLGKKSHEARALWGIPQYCGCEVSKLTPSKDLKDAAKDLIKNLVEAESLNGSLKPKEENPTSNGTTKDESSLNWLADVALNNEGKSSSSDTDLEEKDGNYSTLRELLIRPSHKTSRSSSPTAPAPTPRGGKASRLDTLDEVISSVVEQSVGDREEEAPADSKPVPELEHFVRRYNWFQKDRDPLPIRIMTHTESKILYPDLPHAWLCDGKLLRLTDPQHADNGRIFADQWRRGQPVLVSDVSQHLDNTLWHPDSFARDFGDDKNDLINCMTGNLVPNQPMRKFWEGFEHFSRRLKDEHGNAMLLKLKDWPPGEDFAEMLPSRFKDLMRVLPMPEYTNRTGYLNLASRLPDCFVRPDLGPKMYNAYGSALHPSKGTTNLHLDISDAVNVMVYIGIPVDSDNDEHIKEAFRAIDEAGCDILTRRRVRDKGELPGALWHIYHSRDADKIRDLLNKISLEDGVRLEPHHDPIHDQSWYLDSHLRERLYKEYSVEGYAIVQCLGDAVFIPAGAPHQVRNLHNCIKVAEDFVSPENVSHCFHLTQEFRELSNDHTNHEDKLQIKNIIYHAVKDSLAVLSKYTEGELKEKTQSSLEKDNASDACNEHTIDDTSNGNADVPVNNAPSHNLNVNQLNANQESNFNNAI